MNATAVFFRALARSEEASQPAALAATWRNSGEVATPAALVCIEQIEHALDRLSAEP